MHLGHRFLGSGGLSGVCLGLAMLAACGQDSGRAPGPDVSDELDVRIDSDGQLADLRDLPDDLYEAGPDTVEADIVDDPPSAEEGCSGDGCGLDLLNEPPADDGDACGPECDVGEIPCEPVCGEICGVSDGCGGECGCPEGWICDEGGTCVGACRAAVSPADGQVLDFRPAAGEPSGPPPASLRIETARFPADAPIWVDRPFDAITTDMDLDGDPDLLINTHHLQRLEVYANDDGMFRLLNPRGADDTGLYDNRDVASLYASDDEMLGGVDLEASTAIYVWHDLNRDARWHVVLAPGPEGMPEVELGSSVRFVFVEGAPEEGSSRPDDYTLVIEPFTGEPLHMRVDFEIIAHNLFVRPGLLADSEPVPVVIGPEHATLRQAEVELWKADPHGIAWVDVEGSPEPELYLNRGGVRARLVPPQPPKRDRYYLLEDGRFDLDPLGVIPRDYGRGREVEWVDVDANGELELWVSNKSTDNRLLVRQKDGTFEDVVPTLGPELEEGIITAWLDVDGDGFDDIVALEPGGFRVGLNRLPDPFVMQDGGLWGLTLSEVAAEIRSFTNTSLMVVDIDSDGELDLWLYGYEVEVEDGVWGPDQTLAFVRRGDVYEDATESMGLSGLQFNGSVVFGDLTNDGYVDALALGDDTFHYLLGRGAAGFERLTTECVVGMRTHSLATFSDIDLDGWLDVALFNTDHHRRMILGGLPQQAHHSMQATFDEDRPPVGAVVRAYYADGTVYAQRYGSANNTRWSQALLPLHYGWSDDRPITRFGVVWPGSTTELFIDALAVTP